MSGGGGGVQQSPGERALADLSLAQWKDYESRYVPLENKHMEAVRQDEGDRGMARGVAGADTAQAFQPLVERAAASGGPVGHVADVVEDRTLSSARNQVGASNTVDDQHYRGLAKSVSLGRNIADSATLGFRNAASMGAAQARADAEAAATRQASKMDAVGTIAGAGTRYGAEGFMGGSRGPSHAELVRRRNTGFRR